MQIRALLSHLMVCVKEEHGRKSQEGLACSVVHLQQREGTVVGGLCVHWHEQQKREELIHQVSETVTYATLPNCATTEAYSPHYLHRL